MFKAVKQWTGDAVKHIKDDFTKVSKAAIKYADEGTADTRQKLADAILPWRESDEAKKAWTQTLIWGNLPVGVLALVVAAGNVMEDPSTHGGPKEAVHMAVFQADAQRLVTEMKSDTKGSQWEYRMVGLLTEAHTDPEVSEASVNDLMDYLTDNGVDLEQFGFQEHDAAHLTACRAIHADDDTRSTDDIEDAQLISACAELQEDPGANALSAAIATPLITIMLGLTYPTLLLGAGSIQYGRRKYGDDVKEAADKTRARVQNRINKFKK